MAGLVNRHTSHSLPLKASSVFAEVNGFAARLLATLTYYNDCEYDVEGLFVFPQDDRTTVVEFEATIEERHVSTEIREKTSIGVSKSSYAIEEREDDLFSMSIGRIPPLASIFVQVGLITELFSDRKTGGSLFVLPSVFTPRLYNENENEVQQNDLYGSQMLISDLPRKTHELYSFDLQLEVVAPCLLAGCSSTTHAIQVDADSRATNASRIHITIAEPHTYDRELEVLLHLSHPFDPYVLIEEGKKILIPLENNENISCPDNSSSNLQTLMDKVPERPAVMINFAPQLGTLTQQCSEFIFLVDRSGSMSGKHIFHVKETLVLLLKSLPSNSCFNIVGFGSYYRTLFQTSQEYNHENLEKAMNYVNKMRADLGGTNLILPLEFIFEQPTKRGRPRIVFLITDGGVSNTLDVLDLVRNHSHTCRFYTFGIGPEACPHLVQGVAGPSTGKSWFITEEERITPKVMQAMDAALRPAITDIEVSWHLPDGYDVIQTPSKVPFIFDGERLILYGILSRPPDVEKESPKTPGRRRLDHMMRSFSNNSVKVFWFDDDMEYLPEEQLLLELEEQEQRASQETISELEDDVFGSKPQIRLRAATVEKVDHNSEQINPRSDTAHPKNSNGSPRRRLRSKSEAIDLKPVKTGNPLGNLQDGLAVSDDDVIKNCRTPFSSPLSRDMNDPTRDIMFGSFFRDLTKSCDNLDWLDCTKDGKQISSVSINGSEHSQFRRKKFASERLPNSRDNLESFEKNGNELEEETAYQHTSRYHERDSGVGFSMDDGESNDVNGASGAKELPPSSAALGENSEMLINTRVYKNSELLGSIGVPKNFAAVGIKGFVADEEIEQVIPFPISRSCGTSKRPTIHQLLARSLVRDLIMADTNEKNIPRICTIAKQCKIHCRHTAFTSMDQYCYEDEIISALQFANKEDPALVNQKKALKLVRKGGFTTGLGRRLPSPEGSDQDSIEELTTMGYDEEPSDLYRLDRSTTIDSSDGSPAKSLGGSPNHKNNYGGRQAPPLSTRYVIGEKRSQSTCVVASSSEDRISPILALPLKNYMPYVSLAKLQMKNGNWELNEEFSNCIGLPLHCLQQASPLADSTLWSSFCKEFEEIVNLCKCENGSQLWATALALAWLCRLHSEYQNEWFLIARKADHWLAESDYPYGFTRADLKKLAYQALVLLCKGNNPTSESLQLDKVGDFVWPVF